MASAYQVVIDTKRAEKLFGRFKPELESAIRKLYFRAGALTQREMRINAPKGVSAISIRESISFEVHQGYVEISPKKKFGKWDASVVELGRRPGKMPPWKKEWNPDFVKWADSKGIDPFVLARSIAKKGTKGAFFVKGTKEKIEPRVNRWANEVIRDFAKEMNQGGR